MRVLRSALFLLTTALYAATPAAIDAERVGNRIHLPVSVNGNAPVAFVLDTGAGTTSLDAEYAKQLGIEGESGGKAQGAAGSVEIRVAKDVALRVGEIDHAMKRLPLIPLGPVSLRAGRPIGGVLGRDLLGRFVTDFDYAASTITFHDPAAFQPPAGAVSLPFTFENGLPTIRVPVTLDDGRTLNVRLMVDSGAGAAVVLKKHFVEKNRIDTSRGISASIGLGVGGATKERIGRVARLELAGVAFTNPVTMFSESTAGALADRSSDGILGGEILSRFRFITDYPHKRLWFVPTDAVKGPFHFDGSGVQLTARDATFAAVDIFNVLPDSAAADAGLKAGDELRAIDGREVKAAELPDIRDLFKQPGKTYKLTISRGGEEKEITLTTRTVI
ncbi:MAG TPA: aspartyl protease family protein [Thermoanaerobaculia bacterium]|nr:aspartyl protease family protein [Thermoanaerobaculia bacterium]